jgi:predicted Rossmann fold nucleotide-binding protein DprA/Smf involved in DNA uptake
MSILKKDLQVLNKDIQALGKTIDILIATVEKGEKAKATKRASTKKAPVTRKTAQPTATDQVLKIINRSKKGVNAATLMTKTGFDLKKVRNILQRTYKMGKIKRVGKGVYVGAE